MQLELPQGPVLHWPSTVCPLLLVSHRYSGAVVYEIYAANREEARLAQEDAKLKARAGLICGAAARHWCRSWLPCGAVLVAV